MFERRESGFDKAGRFLLNLALLILLTIGLWKVVGPEIYHIVSEIRGEHRTKSGDVQGDGVIRSTLPANP